MTGKIDNSMASGHSRMSASFGEDGMMQVAGLVVSTAEFSVPFQSGLHSMGREDLEKEIQRVLGAGGIHDLSNRGPYFLHGLCKILLSNDLSDSFSPARSDYSSSEHAEIYLRSLILREALDSKYSHSGFTKDRSSFGVSFRSLCHNRNLFKCTDGRIGIGPSATIPWDKVVVLLGCDSAMILRPCKQDYYRVVGGAYCEDIMDGEALLGPLPEGFRIVWRYNESTQVWYQSFLEKKSDKFYAEDPRLGKLPRGWRKDEHPNEEFFSRFVNDETSGDIVYFDPRLAPEALRERGVKLEEFKLI